jgi:hypothetical protein
VEKYNTLRVDISLKLRQMRAQKNKSENKDKKETNDTEEDSESQTLPLIYNESKKPQDDTVNSHTPESDENNEKTQQQEATPAQLKSDKETTAPKLSSSVSFVSFLSLFSLLFF